MKIKDFLLPTKSNNHSPHILQKVAMGFMVGLVLMSFALTNFQALWWQTSDWLVGTVLPATVVDLTNKERSGLAVSSLTRNDKLDEAAQLKAEHMAKNSYFAHYSPDGVTPWYWFDQVSYKYVHAGENLAIHFSDSKAVIDAWMNSPTHRANIVDQKFTEIGVGTAKGTYEGYDTVFVVQLFGTPGMEKVAPILPKSEVSVVTDESVFSTEVAVVKEGVANEELISEKVMPEESEVAGVTIDEKVESNHSSFIATTSDLVPTPLEEVQVTANNRSSGEQLASVVTRPNLVLQAIYLVLGILVALSLFISIMVSLYYQRFRQVSYGALLLLLMSGLFYLHYSLLNNVVIASS